MEKIKLNKGWTVDRLVALIEKHVPESRWGCRRADTESASCLYYRESDQGRCGVGAVMPDEAMHGLRDLEFPILELDPSEDIDDSSTVHAAREARRVFDRVQWDMPMSWEGLNRLQKEHDNAYGDHLDRGARAVVVAYCRENYEDGDPT